MRCPNCNAPITTEETRAGTCNYCGAALGAASEASPASPVASPPLSPGVLAMAHLIQVGMENAQKDAEEERRRAEDPEAIAEAKLDEAIRRKTRFVMNFLWWAAVLGLIFVPWTLRGLSTINRWVRSDLHGERIPALVTENGCLYFGCRIRDLVLRISPKNEPTFTMELVVTAPDLLQTLSKVKENSTTEVTYDPKGQNVSFDNSRFLFERIL